MHLLRALLCFATAALPAVAAEVGFQRIPVGQAVVSLRTRNPAPGTSCPIWLHLHGATDTVEHAFARIGAPGVLVTLTLPGLSKVYADHFSDPGVLEHLLADVARAVRGAQANAAWTPGELTVSSFSAGFGGVRQLLRQPAAFDQIATLVMADSIYCGYVGATRQLDPALMEGFVRFARLAVDGRKRMLVTHTEQVPEGYGSTTETADYLIAAVGGTRGANEVRWEESLTQKSGYARGGLEVVGFQGAAAGDHLQQLRSLGLLLERAQTPRSSQ